MREVQLRWLGHVKKRREDVLVRKCEKLVFRVFRRGRGRPKKSWKEVIKHDLTRLSLIKDMAKDMDVWRARIRVKEDP